MFVMFCGVSRVPSVSTWNSTMISDEGDVDPALAEVLGEGRLHRIEGSHGVQSFALVMYCMRSSWVAVSRGTSPVIRPADRA